MLSSVRVARPPLFSYLASKGPVFCPWWGHHNPPAHRWWVKQTRSPRHRLTGKEYSGSTEETRLLRTASAWYLTRKQEGRDSSLSGLPLPPGFPFWPLPQWWGEGGGTSIYTAGHPHHTLAPSSFGCGSRPSGPSTGRPISPPAPCTLTPLNR